MFTDPLHLLKVLGTEDSVDSDQEIDPISLLVAAKRSLQKLTPTLLQDTYIDDEKLLSKVWETNRLGVEKMIQKIVCPFCFTLIAPQCRKSTNRPGHRRWDVTNFNRHLNKAHASNAGQ